MARRVQQDNFINSTTGRTLVYGIFLTIVAIVLISRIFYLQIVTGEEALNDFTLKIKKERTINSSRGNIYDRNGNLLAYNELAYNVTIEDVYESGSSRNKELNKTLMNTISILEKNGDTTIGDFNIILNEKLVLQIQLMIMTKLQVELFLMKIISLNLLFRALN